MIKARPKECVMFEIDNVGATAYIELSEKQKWKVYPDCTDEKMVIAKMDIVSLVIPKEQFKKYFVVIK